MILNGKVAQALTCFFAADTVLLAEYDGMCDKKEMTVNVRKHKLMVLKERSMIQLIFGKLYCNTVISTGNKY